LANGICRCNPFYSGSSCGTYEGCPEELDETVCERLLKDNYISQKSLPNEEPEKREVPVEEDYEDFLKNIKLREEFVEENGGQIEERNENVSREKKVYVIVPGK
jgi:hypothetical protein